ncbi:hypothetical protein HDV05_007145 [Chytridiales sp. JEL 0842]|nr:hypothetical protein HDV05_007145 [Chytridiales sp. JEL 0842]
MEFLPERWDNGFTPAPGTYLPFLDGAHMCVGWKMAMLEIKNVVARVLHRYRVSVVKDQELNLVTSITHGFKDGIQMAYNRAFEILVERQTVPWFLWDLFRIGESYAKREMVTLREIIMTTSDSKRASLKSNSGAAGRTVEGMSKLDVLDGLLEVGGWTDEEIIDEVIALFLTGGETSANTITFVFWLLDQQPQVLSKIQEELDRILGPCKPDSPIHGITWDELSDLRYIRTSRQGNSSASSSRHLLRSSRCGRS